MSGFDTLIHSLYLIAAASFVLGLHLMTSPASAHAARRHSLRSVTRSSTPVQSE
jgi:H+-translocating NAD(P) transhydrogenase subunit beta